MEVTSLVEQFPFIWILGTRVHMVELPDVLQLMEHWIQENQRCRYIVVSNMHAIIEAHKHTDFKHILNSADLFVPDGISTVWSARSRGFPLKRRVCGSDLMWAFCELASQKGYTNFFYGDTGEVLRLLTGRLSESFPRLRVVGTYSPPFRPLTPEEDGHIISLINRARPDVLWVGLGLPKQERWMFEHKDQLNVPVMVGVGAAFKFVSGKVRRAPLWMRELNLEWFWRLVHEPRTVWRRAFVYGPQFVYYNLLELSRLKKWE
jgi:N-acetylglucosaminyldiphosphoundecaprenol N-acetyl-beta-D-mannosaminyltransferase